MRIQWIRILSTAFLVQKNDFSKNVLPLSKIFYLSVNELEEDGFDNIETENNNLEEEDEDKVEDKMNCS